MRMMVKFWLPIDVGNELIRSGKIEKVFEKIAEDLKPEATYFFPDNDTGERGGFYVTNLEDSSQVAQIAERFFLGLHARIEMMPVMAAEDLGKAMSGFHSLIERYG